MTADERVRTVREAYQATIRANEGGLPWDNPWAAAVAALDAYDGPNTKALAEVATKPGYELGRKEALSEAAAKLWGFSADPHDTHGDVANGAFAMAAGIVQGMVSTAQEAPSEPLAASTGHSDLPKGGEGL